MDTFALILALIGTLNWALYGLFQVDLIGGIFGNNAEPAARTVYSIIGLGGLWCITILFRQRENTPIGDKNY